MVALFSAITFVSCGQSPRIMSLDNDGFITFHGAALGTTASVEWVSSTQDPARTNWQNWTSILVTSPVMRIPWPHYFRVLAVPAAVAPTDGLIAYYPFDQGSGQDAAGVNDGTVVGATETSDPWGREARALSFDGNDYVQMANPLPDLGSVTISVWARVTEWSANEQTIMVEGDTTPGADLMLQFKIGGALYFPTKAANNLLVPTNPVPLNTWCHIVGTADGGTLSKRLYVNGSLVGTTNMLGSACVGNHYRLQVGRLFDGSLSTDYYIGQLDELRIYNRALSSNEVRQLYFSSP
jgi:hypothetical protein